MYCEVISLSHLLLRRNNGLYGKKIVGVLRASGRAAPQLSLDWSRGSQYGAAQGSLQEGAEPGLSGRILRLKRRPLSYCLPWKRTGWGEFSAARAVARLLSDPSLPIQAYVLKLLFFWRSPSTNPSR